MTSSPKPTPELLDLLNDMKPIPARDPRSAARGRTVFLAQAYSLHQAISTEANPRLKGWKLFTFRKEKFAMNIIFTLALVTTLLFGGIGTTAYAAQNDLPNEPLYPIKLDIEDARLWLNTDPQTEIDLLMEMSQTRVQEMIALNQAGDVIPEATLLRLQQQIQDALHTTAALDTPDMDRALLRIRTSLQTQDQLMIHAQDQATEPDRLMLQTQTMLQTRLRLVEDGLTDPQGFRNAVRNQNQFQNQNQNIDTPPPDAATPPPTTPPGNGNGQNPGGNEQPGSPQSGNPEITPGGNGNHEGSQPGPGNGGNGGNKP